MDTPNGQQSKQIGERIKDLRVAMQRRTHRRMTQQAVADGLDVHVQTYGAWERGEQIPEGPNLVRLAQYFDVDADYIVSGYATSREPPEVSGVRESHGAYIVPAAGSAQSIIDALGDPEFIRRQAGTVTRQEWADFGYQIALRRQLGPDEMKRIMEWREAILRDDG